MSKVYDFAGPEWLLKSRESGGPILQAASEQMNKEADMKARPRARAPPDAQQEIEYTKRMQKLQLKAELEIRRGKKLRSALSRAELIDLANWCVQVRDYILLDRIIYDDTLDPTTTLVHGVPLAETLTYDPRYDGDNERYEKTRALLAGEFINTVFQHNFLRVLLGLSSEVRKEWKKKTPRFYTDVFYNYVQRVQDERKAKAS